MNGRCRLVCMPKNAGLMRVSGQRHKAAPTVAEMLNLRQNEAAS